MSRHASKEMQRIRRIGNTLYDMYNLVWNHLDEILTREEIAEVISATPQERHVACYHIGLTKEDADELSLTAEQTVKKFEDYVEDYESSFGGYSCTINDELKYAVCHAVFMRSNSPHAEIPGWTTAYDNDEIYDVCDTREEAEKALDEAMQNIIYGWGTESDADFCEGYELCSAYLDDLKTGNIEDCLKTAWYSHDDFAAGIETYHTVER